MQQNQAVSVIPVIRVCHNINTVTESDIRVVRDACTGPGFFYLEDHGIDERLLEQVLQQSQRLFALSEVSKRAISDPILSRGYTAMEEEKLDPMKQFKRGDTKEGFYIGREISIDDAQYHPEKLCGPNQWPTATRTQNEWNEIECQQFRIVMEQYFNLLCDVGRKVIRMLALAIGLTEANYFDSYFDSEPMAALRLLHYAPVQSQPDDGIFACGAHSDYGMITLLLTDHNRGLQILQRAQTSNEKQINSNVEDVWLDIPPRRGAFVVNLGDMLERWTNGIFRSTVHRVLTSGDTERYSIPFFFEPAFDTVIECLPCCTSLPDHPPQYPAVTSGQYLLNKYRQTHSDFTPVVESINVT
jgi:isopenicillin N synthase-like dioxygenase